MRQDLVFLVGSTTSSGVFGGVCELTMIFGSLSAYGWGCFPVLLVVWHGVSNTEAYWPLSGAVSLPWDGDLWESSHQLILHGDGRSLVIQCPELGSPTSEAKAWHPPGAPRPCQPHSQVHGDFLAFWEVWGLLPVFSRYSVGVAPHVDVFLMYSCGEKWSPLLTPLPSWRSSCN